MEKFRKIVYDIGARRICTHRFTETERFLVSVAVFPLVHHKISTKVT